jgi:alcohol dehydrogenase class IV
MNFIYNTPTKVYFGKMDYDNLVAEIKQYGNKVLVLTGGKGTLKIAENLSDKLKENFTVILKDGIKTNPEIELIESIASEVQKADVILTVGGGSVHDSGKALAIAMTHNEKLEEYTTDGKISVLGITNRVIPVITIPTIFGTGAEVSPAALLKIRNKKRVIFSTHIYPKATFIDCSFTTSLSNDMCIKASLDAMVQGIESSVSTKAQSFSRRFSYSAIERVVASLLALVRENEKAEIMEELALASIEGLYAVGQSTVGAAHAISDPISGRYDIHHGEAVGVLLPYVVKANYSYAEKEYETIKLIFEEKLGQTFRTLSEALDAFYAEIGFDRCALQREVDRTTFCSDFEELICESYNGDMDGNPREMTDDIIGDILNKVFGVS